ncbi:MAG: peptidylprolyl isomerase [Verrucomicrobiae bacterium]|jgi:cyclophilin family peptidyl-prolyl cis-trans isomerase|nr:peptidylprolyl isomerase [Verrucomicrobiae bacterium]
MRFFPTSLFLSVVLFLTACATQPISTSSSQVAVMLVRIGNQKEQRRVVIAFNEKAAPQTVANFKQLVARHYYNGLLFYRAFPHSLVQTGDPNTRYREHDNSGTGGPGYTIPAEIRLPHIKGAVAASRLPDKINPLRASNGSQFYICLEPMPQLDGQYTVFGHVTEGMDVLESMSLLPTNSNNFPVEKVVITSLTLESIL